MITLDANGAGRTFHATNREGTAALCRSNITPHSWVVRDSYTGSVTRSFALFPLSGDSFKRSCDYRRVNCLSCQRKLVKLTGEAFDAATREDAARPAVVAVPVVVAPVAAVESTVDSLPVVDGPVVDMKPVFIMVGTQLREPVTPGSSRVMAAGPLRVVGSQGRGAASRIVVVDVVGEVFEVFTTHLRSRPDSYAVCQHLTRAYRTARAYRTVCGACVREGGRFPDRPAVVAATRETGGAVFPKYYLSRPGDQALYRLTDMSEFNGVMRVEMVRQDETGSRVVVTLAAYERGGWRIVCEHGLCEGACVQCGGVDGVS